MSNGTYNPGPLSINAGEAMERFRLALYNTATGFVEYCDDTEQASFLVQRAVAANAAAVLLPIQPNQYIPAVASGAITAGDRVAADDDGKVQSVESSPAGNFVLGRALFTVTTDLDEVTILTSPQDTAPYTGQGAAVVNLTDNSGGVDPEDDTIAIVNNTDALTDLTGGTADDTVSANSSVSVLAFPIADMVLLANGDIVTDFIPGFAGTILSTYWIQEDPVTTASKAADINFEIEATDVTGGAIALTSAACTPLGKYIAGAAVTADNVFTAAEKISIEVSGATAFVEGTGTIYIVVSNDDVNDNFKEVADQLATQRLANTAILAAIAQVTAKQSEIIASLEGAGLIA